MPPSFGAPGQASPPSDPPPPLRLAVRLMYTGAVLTVVGMLIGLAQMDELKNQMAEDDPSLSEAEIDSIASGATVFGVFIALLTAGLWIWMAIMNGKGRSWARVVGTVFGAIASVLVVFSLTLTLAADVNREPPANTIMSVVNLALAVVIIILMFRPESSAYYAARSHRYPVAAYGYGYPPPSGYPPY
jgi:hypothetical protein